MCAGGARGGGGAGAGHAGRRRHRAQHCAGGACGRGGRALHRRAGPQPEGRALVPRPRCADAARRRHADGGGGMRARAMRDPNGARSHTNRAPRQKEGCGLRRSPLACVRVVCVGACARAGERCACVRAARVRVLWRLSCARVRLCGRRTRPNGVMTAAACLSAPPLRDASQAALDLGLTTLKFFPAMALGG
eukprot:3061245-Prymnesium_polylepis.1